MKQVAVIILNWNGAELLRRYLPTVIAGTDAAIADVIVADNGSTDESLQVLLQEFPDVKILKFEKNYGNRYQKFIEAFDELGNKLEAKKLSVKDVDKILKNLIDNE